MPTKLTTWDVSEHLRTTEEMVAYLNAVVEEGDPALLQAALGDLAKAVGMTEVSRRSGLGRESLYKALTADAAVSFKTVAKVAGALGARIEFAPLAPTG
jgi:probable addiction module antidote protein